MRNFFAAAAIAVLAATTVPAHAVGWVSPWANPFFTVDHNINYTTTANGWDSAQNPVAVETAYMGTQQYTYAPADGPNPPDGVQLFANYGGTVTMTSSAFSLAAPTTVGGYYQWYRGTDQALAAAKVEVFQGASLLYSQTIAPGTQFAWQAWSTPLAAGSNYTTVWTWSKPMAALGQSNQGWLHVDGGDTTQTPEPASMMMLGMAATGFLAARRRRKAAKKA